MKKAINLARANGWGGYLEGDYIYRYLLDPFFWQALGKAEGWNNYSNKLWQIHYANGMLFGWEAVWHSFIDHIAEGKDIDSFFNNLLKQP